ncbi:Oidioi.mRNA.OKI2018_I69.PAR.g9947.t1.cds [Oikopleura dioica]|uniref:Oidioi.mRNA.OKI2018_I69.PAR.g9947.t1.cds n=1 Tax=Oikopleura dioica TaxID=34765 RepID=A0ABN7RN43_OIKDI|nr:Oidioi.mRNA.OKI2018_I69.PAR.g9947.t1.cds [Oikopleura dioica]
MGYSPRGSRYEQLRYIHAGTPAFSTIVQLVDTGANNFIMDVEFPVHVWTLCDWNTAWYLLFKPIETDADRDQIKKELTEFRAGWFHKSWGQIPAGGIEGVSKLISILKLCFFTIKWIKLIVH